MISDSKVAKAFFTLLRSGLWDKSIDDLDCFPIQDSEWEAVYKLALAQTVEGLVYDGVNKLPKAYLPPRKLLLGWVVRVSKLENLNAMMNSCITEQVSLFDRLKVSVVLLKGQGLATYYKLPNHRVCGDIDWFFDSKKESKLVESVLIRNRVNITHQTDDSIYYKWKMCEVEHHTKLFDVFSPIASYKLKKLKKAFFKDKIKVNDFYSLPPNLNILQINLHILKHLLAFGIGLRQFCDSAILYASMEGKYDKNWLYKTYKDIGVINWVHDLHHLLVNYLGLPFSSLPFGIRSNSSSKKMIEDVLMAGNFGFFDEKHNELTAANIIERRNKSSRLWYSFKRYFSVAPYEAISFPFVHFAERFKAIASG